MHELDTEDAKLVRLASAARARLGSAEAAAVRDTTGRTYVAGPVALPSLRLGSLQSAVAAAVSSGATQLEAAVVVGGGEPAGLDAAAALLLPGAPVWLVDASGAVVERR
jgi:NADPH-dependent 2,4-dienoyl-CoA reductase/sulfur reductase-like enzyme